MILVLLLGRLLQGGGGGLGLVGGGREMLRLELDAWGHRALGGGRDVWDLRLVLLVGGLVRDLLLLLKFCNEFIHGRAVRFLGSWFLKLKRSLLLLGAMRAYGRICSLQILNVVCEVLSQLLVFLLQSREWALSLGCCQLMLWWGVGLTQGILEVLALRGDIGWVEDAFVSWNAWSARRVMLIRSSLEVEGQFGLLRQFDILGTASTC